MELEIRELRIFVASALSSGNSDAVLTGPAAPLLAAALLGDIGDVAKRSIDEHVRSKRLAFAAPASVLYPKDAAMARKLGATHTTIFQQLQLSGGTCQILSESLSEFDPSCNVSCYASSSSSLAFDWHTDAWNSLIVQVAGRKKFEFGPDKLVKLDPGDCLFFRSGVRHRTGSDLASVHISVNLHPL